MNKKLANVLLMAHILGGDIEGLKSRPSEIDATPKQAPIPKGCKKYYFPGFECIALNQKSATKKYNKWLQTNQP